jgi:hypothetical protein
LERKVFQKSCQVSKNSLMIAKFDLRSRCVSAAPATLRTGLPGSGHEGTNCYCLYIFRQMDSIGFFSMFPQQTFYSDAFPAAPFVNTVIFFKKK